MNTYLVIFLFLFSLLELSCKSRSGNLESVNPNIPIPTKSQLITAMQNFELGQKVIQEMVPKLQNGETFKDYKPHPILKIKTTSKSANQAFSEKTKGKNILEDLNNDRNYFSSLLGKKAELKSHIKTLDKTRHPYNDAYKTIKGWTGDAELARLKGFKSETSIKSESFFDFFMGILDNSHKEPNDSITTTEKILNTMEGVYPSKGWNLYLKQNQKKDITFTKENVPRFLYFEKATLGKNPTWFENNMAPALNTKKSGIYIPYLGSKEDDYKDFVVQNEKDLSIWFKKAAKSIFLGDENILSELPHDIKITTKTGLLGKNKDYPVYYLDSDGKLKPLTKAALATF